jgi:hypothetical protein
MSVHIFVTLGDLMICCKGNKFRLAVGLVIALVFLLVIIFITCYLLSGICFGFHPNETSFVGSRLGIPDTCKAYSPKPCHFYILMGLNVSSQIVVVYQSYIEYKSPVLYFSDDGSTFDQVPAESRYFSHISPFTYRYLYYSSLDNLMPSSTYYLQVGDSMDPTTLSDIKKIRTGPSDNSPFTFAVGGDVGCEFPYPEMTTQEVAKREVLFLALGGDIAYGNGLAGCYNRWDNLLWMWEKYLITPSNYTIPFIMSIGNHEAGVAWGSYDKTTAPYYFNYLPFEAVNGRDPETLDSIHYHLIGNSTVFYALDSEITLHSEDQVTWLSDLMGGDHALLPNKLAIYHVPLYPGSRSITTDPIPNLRTNWMPVFDQYHLKIAFENHDHVFMRSKNLVNGVENVNGTLYIGDGAFGVVGDLAADDSTRDYLAKAVAIRHFMFVDIKDTEVNITVIGYDGSYVDNVLKNKK